MRTLCKKALALCVVFALALTCFVGTLSVSAADTYDAIVSVNASPVTLGDDIAEAVIHITLAESGICEALIKVASPIGSVAKEVELVKDINGTPFDDEIVDETTGMTEFGALDYKVDYSGESSDFGAFFLSTKEYEKDDITEAFIKVTFTIGSDIEAGTYAVNIDTPEGKVIAASKSEDIINLIYDSEANPFIVTCEHEYGETVEVTAPTCTAAGAGTQTCSICKHVKDVEIPATGEHSYKYELGNGETHNFTCTVGGETGSEPCAPGEDGVTCVCGYVFVTEPETFTVTFVDADGSTVLGTDEVEAGAAATAPEVADDAANDKYFTGWDKDFSAITEDTTVTAQYYTFTVRLATYFLNLKGSIELTFKLAADKGNLANENIVETGVLAWPQNTVEDYLYDPEYAYPASWVEEESAYTSYLPIFSNFMNDMYDIRAYAILENGTIVYGKKNGAVQDIFNASVVKYATSRMGKVSSDSLEYAVYVSMLNYGAKAQLAFNYKVDDLANAGLTEEQKVLADVSCTATSTRFVDATTNVNSITDTRIKKVALYLQQIINVEFGVAIDSADNPEDISEVYLLSWKPENYVEGNAVLENATQVAKTVLNAENGIYYGNSADIFADEMRDTIYARGYIVYKDGSTAYTQITTYSVEAYAKSAMANANNSQEIKDASKAMMIYGDASIAYFAQNAS